MAVPGTSRVRGRHEPMTSSDVTAPPGTPAGRSGWLSNTQLA
jgi:hypothetical protein